MVKIFFSSLPILNSQIQIAFSTLEPARASVSKHFGQQSCHSAWLLAVIKFKTNCKCSHIIFIAFFTFWIENAGGDGFNQFLKNILLFWCTICLLGCSDQKCHQKNIGGSILRLWPLIPLNTSITPDWSQGNFLSHNQFVYLTVFL